MDVVHKQLLFLFWVVHEGERLNHFEEKTLINQKLLPLVSVKHLLGVRRHKRVEVGVKFLGISKCLLLH